MQVLLTNARVPVVGFVAPQGTGKTLLLRRVIPGLVAHQVRVGVIKQARNDFDIDQPGKDSFRLRAAGVERLLVTSLDKSALILEHLDATEPELNELLGFLHQDELDVVLVEGFSQQAVPKIALQRAGSRLLCYPHDPWVIAVATDCLDNAQFSVPVLDINAPDTVVEFLLDHIRCCQDGER